MAITESDVRALDQSWSGLADALFTPFVADAQALVDDVLSGETQALRDRIGKWLAAHLYAMSDGSGRRSEHGVGDASEKDGMRFGLGLDGTRYGQTAKAIDTTGNLGRLGLRRAEFRAVVTETD